jgi:uncharacterized protein (TIGR00369 family)
MSAVTADDVNAFLAEAWPGGANECVEIGDRHAVARAVLDQRSIRPGGLISGPTQFGLCDAALWYAVFGAIGIVPMAVTSELSIRFLRPALGPELFARAELQTVGRRTMVGSVSAWTTDPGKPVAIAQGTYLRPV